jgi:hypothetical protein
METTNDQTTAVTFIVRLVRDADGDVAGTVERVRTGRRERFDGYADVGTLLERMVAAEQCANGEARRRT